VEHNRKTEAGIKSTLPLGRSPECLRSGRSTLWLKTDARVDTKTLVVGQRVVMVSGPYGCDGRVVEVTDGGVAVQTFACTTRVPTELLRFDGDGKGLDRGTYECGPWEIARTLTEDEVW
jgi:hypothetical protein